MLGCRALYQDGWKAVTFHEIQVERARPRPGDRGSSTTCGADPSECHDLAAAEPQRLAAMVDRWWAEAERNQVLPLDNRPFSELVFGRPGGALGRSLPLHRYWPGRQPRAESVAVNVRGGPTW